MPTFLIVADDFTGANDTGVQLTRKGFPSYVKFSGAATSLEAGSSYVIDTESRNVSESEASKLVSSCLDGLALGNWDVVMKKVDSTMRGNIACEVSALDVLYQSDLVLVATAFPDLERTCVGARQHLKGKPILETEHAKDPLKPVVEDNLVTLFSSYYPADTITALSVEMIQSDSYDFAKAKVIICDGMGNADLQRVVQRAKDWGKKILYVGTAALADALVNSVVPSKPALGLVASLSSVTAEQVRVAKQAGIAIVTLDVASALSVDTHTAVFNEAKLLLSEGRDVLLVASSVLDKSAFNTNASTGSLIREALAALGKQLIEEIGVCGVFLTGGDTAMGLLEALGIDTVKIEGEIAVGIPLMRIVKGPYDNLKLITKAGGFGKPDSIAYAMRVLKEA